jgi:hypothetical protein
MRDSETVKTITRSIRLSPSMLSMISEEARRRRMTFSSYLRFCALSSIRQAHSELDAIAA